MVLIGEAVWKSKFGAAPSVLGQQVMVDGVAREIIGVLPGELRFPRLAEIWLPLAELRKDQGVISRDNHPGFSALGRLKAGVTSAPGERGFEHDCARTGAALSGVECHAARARRAAVGSGGG